MRYTSAEKQELLNKFHYMDIDHNGELSAEEIKQCLKDSKLPKEKLDVGLVIFKFAIYCYFLIIK